MKRKGNLYPSICEEANILKAMNRAAKGKRHRRDVRRVLADKEKYAKYLHEILSEERFIPSDYQIEKKIDGVRKKEREIFKPRYFPDQIVHWSIYLAIKQWIYKGMYEFSCGSVPRRGVHYGKRFIKQWVTQDRKNTKYYLKMDVRKFYPSVKPDRVMEKLRRLFKDYRLLNLIGLILSKADGLPIGMLLSQVFANFFMTDVDHYIKQELKAVHYVRYMDDMVVFGRNKKELHKMRVAIAAKLAENRLTMKGNWQVCKFDDEPLDFMGFRFYRDRTTLRRSIMLRITRKVRKVNKKGRAANYGDACAVISYMGWIKHSNSHNLFEARIRPYLHLGRMKNIVRREMRNHEELYKLKHRTTPRVGQNIIARSGISQQEHRSCPRNR